MRLEHEKAGDADLYWLTLDDGTSHKFVVSNAQRATSPDGGADLVARHIARIVHTNGERQMRTTTNG